MPPELRAAEPAEFADVLSFWADFTEVASSTDDLAGLTTLHRRDPGALIVAVEGDLIVGTLIAAWDGWRGALYRLAVRDSHRRTGVARDLVTRGEARLRVLGARRVSLYAVEAHPAAMAFWAAVGYRPDRDEVRFVRNLEPPASA